MRALFVGPRAELPKTADEAAETLIEAGPCWKACELFALSCYSQFRVSYLAAGES